MSSHHSQRQPTYATLRSKAESVQSRDESGYLLADLERHPSHSTSEQRNHHSSRSPGQQPSLDKGTKKKRQPHLNIRLLVLAGGQLVIFGLGWGFVGALIRQSNIALPDNLAHLVSSEPSATTFVVSILAAIISMISIRIYSLSVCLALTSKLHRRATPLLFSGFSVSASMGRMFIKLRHPTWTCTSIITMVVLTSLSSGWTSLLNPTVILLSDPIRGNELDLISPTFSYLLNNSSVSQNGTNNSLTALNDDSYNVLGLSGPLAGHSAGGLDVPSFFSLNGATYNISTGGILPSIQSSVYSVGNPPTSGLQFDGGSTRVNTTSFNTTGLSQNFTMTQQGLTAHVNCSEASPDSFSVDEDVTSPASYRIYSATAYCNRSLDYVANGPYYSGGGCDGVDCIFIVPCPLQDSTAPSNKSFTISIFSNAAGSECRYSFIPNTTCTVTPMTTTVVAQYNDRIITPTTSNSSESYAVGQYNPSALAFLASVVQWFGGNAQNLVSNSVGDSVYVLRSMQNQTNLQSSNDPDNIIFAEQEDYWRGVVEFGGTYLRSGFSTVGSELPEDMLTPISGNVSTLTMGWSYRPKSTLAALVPQTLITLFTLMALAAVRRDAGALHDSVDVTDVSDVVLSTTAGRSGVQGVTAGKEKKERLEGETVRLTEVDDSRKILVLGN
ncbi:hypothetical protein CONPUDRAFT_147731 [Coniophora puteana RWD-64-598 SS2]|uniref:Uncharacterized protein n=1 Tax=Coniophora puteana (strain RWD-64-598) TaxID=741705 RepID=R7SDX1_CONPW|nr:uncharacterized protein CONPUDRAFT_147731 [Coniophora puteana RWD-64-598 SS2]EIW74366.1 hypothetical protein CONPUDRAFT_147731 [Coniophora puteana RWD-64-598 SS2]